MRDPRGLMPARDDSDDESTKKINRVNQRLDEHCQRIRDANQKVALLEQKLGEQSDIIRNLMENARMVRDGEDDGALLVTSARSPDFCGRHSGRPLVEEEVEGCGAPGWALFNRCKDSDEGEEDAEAALVAMNAKRSDDDAALQELRRRVPVLERSIAGLEAAFVEMVTRGLAALPGGVMSAALLATGNAGSRAESPEPRAAAACEVRDRPHTPG